MSEATLTGPRRLRSRRERIRATREQVLVHATELFVERGYLETTMGDIAAAAGVSVQTLYLRFGGKPALLGAAFDRAVAGDVEEVPIVDRPWFTELRRAPTFAAALRIAARNSRLIHDRVVPLFTRLEQASADTEVAEIYREMKRRRYETTGVVARIMLEKPGADPAITVERAADVLYALASEEFFRLLCVERGWSSEEWEEFVIAAATRELAAGGT